MKQKCKKKNKDRKEQRDDASYSEKLRAKENQKKCVKNYIKIKEIDLVCLPLICEKSICGCVSV